MPIPANSTASPYMTPSIKSEQEGAGPAPVRLLPSTRSMRTTKDFMHRPLCWTCFLRGG
jgi:hypothetical protein